MVRTKVEYATEQITVYPSCPYNCKYCWAQEPLWESRIQKPFKRYGNEYPIMQAKKCLNARKPGIIVLSFNTDPYQPLEMEKQYTRKVLEMLVDTIHDVLILTKNPMLAVERDLDLLQHKNVWLGTTLTSLRKISDEPNAPSNDERIKALRIAHENGVKTWVSIEPWIPEKTDPCRIIEETHDFVDYYVLGRLNYEKKHGYPEVPNEFYLERLPSVIGLLEKYGKMWLTKKELSEEFFNHSRSKDFVLEIPQPREMEYSDFKLNEPRISDFLNQIEPTFKGLGIPVLYAILSILAKRSVFFIGVSGIGKDKVMEIIPQKDLGIKIVEWDSFTQEELSKFIGTAYYEHLIWAVPELSTFSKFHRRSFIEVAPKIMTKGSHHRHTKSVRIDIKNCDLTVLVGIQPKLYGELCTQQIQWDTMARQRFSKFFFLSPYESQTVDITITPTIPQITPMKKMIPEAYEQMEKEHQGWMKKNLKQRLEQQKMFLESLVDCKTGQRILSDEQVEYRLEMYKNQIKQQKWKEIHHSVMKRTDLNTLMVGLDVSKVQNLFRGQLDGRRSFLFARDYLIALCRFLRETEVQKKHVDLFYNLFHPYLSTFNVLEFREDARRNLEVCAGESNVLSVLGTTAESINNGVEKREMALKVKCKETNIEIYAKKLIDRGLIEKITGTRNNPTRYRLNDDLRKYFKEYNRKFFSSFVPNLSPLFSAES